ncbi:uncharacterized protein LOC111390270 [Olea europaea var. sylvestris]|uniref:uncharacterized protein LOC111390270 n=1 Tax=Olea europaea var. sylvestris TaxID=158386 RepID=UPI000C1CDF6C|nr:uncharacterized protein LOC111390270 [Olea europaea var. sylvestris]
MLNTYGVYLSYSKAWRSREQTLKMIRGDPAESFGALIRGWEHCRSVIVVDGTYLNGKYGGTLFTACTQDANNSIFIFAFGIGDNENDKSWRWFFAKMKKAYGNREGLCFVSDRHPSIKNAIEHVYLGACHGICSYHLLQNLKSYYEKSGQNITQAFNSAVRAYTLEEYCYNMPLLTMMNEKIISYLADIGLEKWSRIHMPTNRYSIMTLNIVESVNAVTKAAKNYPIVSLLESLRQTIQSWFCRQRDDAHGTFTKLSSKYEKEIRKMSMDLRNLRIIFYILTLRCICDSIFL